MPYMMSVPRGKRLRGRVHERVSIDVTETCCEFLVIHKAINSDPEWPEWTITHIKTGWAVIRHLPSQDAARKVAGAISQIFTWSQRHAPGLINQHKWLEPKVRAWFDAWVKAVQS